MRETRDRPTASQTIAPSVCAAYFSDSFSERLRQLGFSRRQSGYGSQRRAAPLSIDRPTYRGEAVTFLTAQHVTDCISALHSLGFHFHCTDPRQIEKFVTVTFSNDDLGEFDSKYFVYIWKKQKLYRVNSSSAITIQLQIIKLRIITCRIYHALYASLTLPQIYEFLNLLIRFSLKLFPLITKIMVKPLKLTTYFFIFNNYLPYT